MSSCGPLIDPDDLRKNVNGMDFGVDSGVGDVRGVVRHLRHDAARRSDR